MWALTHCLNPITALLQPEGSLPKGRPAGLGRQDPHTPCPVPAAEAPHTDTSSHRKLSPYQGLLGTSIFSSSLSAGTVPSTSEHFLSLLWVKEIVHLTPFPFHTVLFSPLPSSQLPTMDRRQEDWLQVTYITIPYIIPRKDTFLPDTVEGSMPPCLLSVHLVLTHHHTRVALSNPLNLIGIIPR